MCDALDRAGPDPEALGHPQDANTLRKLPPHLAFGRAVYLRPTELHALGNGALEACFDFAGESCSVSNSAKDGGGDRPVQEILDDLQEPKTVGLQAAVEATRNLLPKLEADLKALTKAYNTKRKIGAR